MTGSDTTLALENISKRFGATQALSDVSLRVRRRTIHALLGENGAGKTTLMRIAHGLIQADSGQIRLDERVVRFASPNDAIRRGIGMVHQHFTIVQAMTVAENVALGGHGRFDARATGDRVREIATATGMAIDPDARAGALGVTAQQQLEIIKVLARDAHVLILDEPTAALPPSEATHLLQQLRALATTGLSIVLITHKLREALVIADDITVLRRGRVVLAAPAAAVNEETLAREMLGGALSIALGGTDRSPAAVSTGTPIVRAQGITINDDRGVSRVRSVTLDVWGGEIVGIAGAEGAGVHELMRGLTGHLPLAQGVIHRPGHIGFIPEDRHREAVALPLSVVENVALRGVGSRRGIARWSALRQLTRDLLTEFDVRTPGMDVPIAVLSGGNQQKLVLARELSNRPDLLVAENPTRGLDVRATAAIHARLRAARDAGAAIVFYSSDLDELLAIADRIFAMYAGTLIAAPRDRDAIGEAMLGAGPTFS